LAAFEVITEEVVSIGQLERSGALGSGSLKPKQWQSIESDIQDSLSYLSGRFCSYRLFLGAQADFETGGVNADCSWIIFETSAN